LVRILVEISFVNKKSARVGIAPDRTSSFSSRFCGRGLVVQWSHAVSRFFFDIHDGIRFFQDHEGQECADVGDIRNEAMKTLPEIAKGSIVSRGDHPQMFTMLVRNENGQSVYTATLNFAGLWLNEVALTD